MTRVQAVIFDLDDTLYPERDYAFSGFDAVAAEFEATLGDRAQAATIMRRLFRTEHRRRVFDALLRERGLEPGKETVGRMIRAYRSHRPTIDLYPDADAALSQLGGRYRLGLITDGPAVTQTAKIDALSLRDRLHAIILTDELGQGLAKPHPRAFETIVDELETKASCCMYVGDNAAKDFVAPNALGWTTVRVRRKDGVYLDQPPSPGGRPQHTIDSLNELDRLL